MKPSGDKHPEPKRPSSIRTRKSMMPDSKSGGQVIHAEKSSRKLVNINNNCNDGANYDEIQSDNQEYNIYHNVNDTMYNEQPESLSLDRHDKIEFYIAAITPSTSSHKNRSFIKKEKTNNRNQDQERFG